MRLPKDVWVKYRVEDVDTLVFLELFDEEPGAKVLEVGANEEPTANIMAECGYDVTGVDLREYDSTQPPCNYNYVRADFCDLPAEFLREHLGTVDCIVALSCLEHFGMNTYQEKRCRPNYDIGASLVAWNLLRYGGTMYVTVPFGGIFRENLPHWRIYTFEALMHRIVQDFLVEDFRVVIAGPIRVSGKKMDIGDQVSFGDAMSYTGGTPHITAYMKLRKGRKPLLAPDGR